MNPFFLVIGDLNCDPCLFMSRIYCEDIIDVPEHGSYFLSPASYGHGMCLGITKGPLGRLLCTASVLQTTFTYYVFRFYCSLFLGYVRSGSSQTHFQTQQRKQVQSFSMDDIWINSASKLQCHHSVWSFDSSHPVSQLTEKVDDKTTKYGLRSSQVISQGLICHHSM